LSTTLGTSFINHPRSLLSKAGRKKPPLKKGRSGGVDHLGEEVDYIGELSDARDEEGATDSGEDGDDHLDNLFPSFLFHNF
jgi:hypothetical protein